MKTKLLWNGCDGYVELNDAKLRGYSVVGDFLYHGAQEFRAFEVQEISIDSLHFDKVGDASFVGVFISETGKFYK